MRFEIRDWILENGDWVRWFPRVDSEFKSARFRRLNYIATLRTGGVCCRRVGCAPFEMTSWSARVLMGQKTRCLEFEAVGVEFVSVVGVGKVGGFGAFDGEVFLVEGCAEGVL